MTSSSPAPDPRLAPGLLLLAGLAAGLPGLARAQQEAPAPSPVASQQVPPAEEGGKAEGDGEGEGPPPQAGEVIVIYGEREVQRLRGELDGIIEDGGYKEGRRRGDETIYRPQIPWKPTIVVHEEGLVELKRSPVRWMAPGRPDNPLNQLWCLPPFTPMCVRIGGQIVATAKLDAAKGRVMDTIHDPAEDWRMAIANQATWTRVNQEVPERLEAAWTRGEPLEPGGPALPSPAQRRAAMLELWASRADSPEGEMVAQVVADFLEHVVQQSAEPVTAAEQEAANARAGGVRRLALPGLSEAPTPTRATVTPDPG